MNACEMVGNEASTRGKRFHGHVRDDNLTTRMRCVQASAMAALDRDGRRKFSAPGRARCGLNPK